MLGREPSSNKNKRSMAAEITGLINISPTQDIAALKPIFPAHSLQSCAPVPFPEVSLRTEAH